MCKSELHGFLAGLPKCEHHMHLEGSLSPELLFTLAATNGITLPSVEEDSAFESPATLEARYEHFTSLDDFLHYYFIGISVLRTTSDFEALAYEYFTRAHRDGVVHAEVFFDPQAHTSRGVAYTSVVEGFTAARTRAFKEYRITSELILCFLRHLPVEEAHATYQQAISLAHFSNGTVAGIGLDSSELDFPPELFKEIFTAAADQGIKRTAHAGEEGDSTYISRALDYCKVQRIDHGVHLADDKALMSRVAEKRLLVTMCPLSNVRLRCVKSIGDLSVREFLENGVRFSINSDDPAYFGGYMLENYCAVQDAFNLSIEEWTWIVMASIEGSWCEPPRKKDLVTKLQVYVRRYKGEIS
jgi:adenosine deaminase